MFDICVSQNYIHVFVFISILHTVCQSVYLNLKLENQDLPLLCFDLLKPATPHLRTPLVIFKE